MSDERRLRVAEVFGPTVQGEGPSTGTPAVFVRLWGCNLDCAWCDTPYTWDIRGRNGVAYSRDAESTLITPVALADQVDRIAPQAVVVVTGGEPLLQASQLLAFVGALGPGRRIEVETNGTVGPPVDSGLIRYNVSPKLAHAGTTRDAIRLDTLREFARLDRSPVSFKFVARTAADLDEVAAVVAGAGLDARSVYVMPEGRDADTILARTAVLAPHVIDRGYNLSTRLHVLMWGDRRGV